MSQSLDRDEVETLAPSHAQRVDSFELSGAGRVLLAVLSGAAGVIHLTMVPSHWGSSATEGFGFALAGWAQIAIAVMLLASPSRVLLRVTMIINVLAICAWMISRSWGLPFGEHPGQPHDAQFIDLVCVGIEAALVVLASSWLRHPGIGRDWRGWRVAVFAIVPFAVLTLATAALASPSARNHAHASHSAHETAASGASTGHTHADPTSDVSNAAADSPSSAASAGSTEIVSLSGKHVHGVKAQDVAAELQPDVPLDASTRALLAQQIVVARDTAMRYPTAADAVAAGYRRIGGFGPGAGAHYIGGGGFGAFDPARPTALIYDGTSPTSQMVGLMYTGGAETAPDGFAGPNDHWHRHSSVCLKGADTLFPTDSDVTEQQCTAAGGRYMERTTWMVHAWVVPSWESPSGVFSHENPNLRCADGSYDTDALGRCEGS